MYISQVVLTPTAVNSGRSFSSRGEFIESKSVISDGLYEASNFTPMLSTTRNLIYNRWRNECVWLFQTYSISYESCLRKSI